MPGDGRKSGEPTFGAHAFARFNAALDDGITDPKRRDTEGTLPNTIHVTVEINTHIIISNFNLIGPAEIKL